MKRINSTGILSGLLTGGMLVAGCSGDDVVSNDTEATGTTTGGNTPMTTAVDTADSTGPGEVTGTDSSTGDPTGLDSSSEGGSSSSDGGVEAVPVEMFLEITNVSGEAVVFSPISPGVWLNHESAAELILPERMPRTGEGLEALAEDGDPSTLAPTLMDNNGYLQSGVFDTPEGAGAPGALLPGDTYRVEFTADPLSRMSMAMMLVGSNDWLLATGAPGIGMFAGGGQPLGVRDVTNLLRVWDAGTEANQAPSQGPWQPANSGANEGAAEAGGVFQHNDSTRAIPLPADLIDVRVTLADAAMNPDEFTITITNTSYESGTLVTPLSDFFWMTHDDTAALFEMGAAASNDIELLAEDGDTSGLDAAFNAGAPGIGLAAAITGPFLPGTAGGDGDTIEFVVNTSNVTPMLSFATMVVESNDAFLATPPAGIALYDDGGLPRDNEDIEDDILRLLTVWDAGTEANETPGVGPNQVLRGGPDSGPADADTNVRIYSDSGSDLAGASVGGIVDVTITESGGDFTVRIENTSFATGYPAVLTPAFYMLHDANTPIFELGSGASPGLESLAEDGSAAALLGEWDSIVGVLAAGIQDTPLGEATPGPLLPGPVSGDVYEFVVTPTANSRFLSFAQMIVPSNDTFLAFSPGGIPLLTADGDVIDPVDIAASIAAELQAWDAGTEGNQAGAAGRDQAPRQGLPNTGLDNGSGLVRVHENGPTNTIIWSAPQPNQVVRVTLGPVAGE